jgi:hypothetical protein
MELPSVYTHVVLTHVLHCCTLVDMAHQPSNGMGKMAGVESGGSHPTMTLLSPAQQQQQQHFLQMQTMMQQQQMFMSMLQHSQAGQLSTAAAISSSAPMSHHFGALFPSPPVLPTAQATVQPNSHAVVYGPAIPTVSRPKGLPRSPELPRHSNADAHSNTMLPPHMQSGAQNRDVDQLEALVMHRIKQRSEDSNDDDTDDSQGPSKRASTHADPVYEGRLGVGQPCARHRLTPFLLP